MKIGTTQLELIELAAREFREWNWQVGGMFWKSALGHLQYVTEQISEPYSERVKRRLYAVAADLGETVAHMARDLGYHAEAQRYYGLALRAAREAQEWALGAHILASMAGHMIELGHPHEGLELVHLAQKGERGQATPTLRAMLRIRESWAYVKMAEPRDGRRAISQAEDEFSDYQPTDDPHWLRYVSSAEFNGVCGSRYRDLVRYDTRALEHSARSYEVALAMRDPQYVRSRALDYTGLAKVRLLQGEVEQACATADKALAIAEKIQSPTVTQKIHEFLRQVMQYRSLGSVRVFEEKVHVVLGVSV
ncbi:putative regulatory protein [Carbonactinospora thermoautotrophica]|uniref:Putative regulatory protein n=1 Tax=Carbonactinospora thermoautotrophica TaxID=1469144 RepID=A0A132MWW2_9ACTN|nr:hypothetical protein [Carbonactinospora thermoautotrophica]KWX02226.1 putative regulatory protein [Carbonactinospora thermoautotrophica]